MTEERDFWTRRKAAVAAEAEAEHASRAASEDAEAQARLNGFSDAELLEELNLPEPENLLPGDDFSVFMTRAVPDRLRRRALRVLWRTNPVLANVDGLIDYGADYTDSATVVENLQTAYTVGRGMLAHVERLAQSVPESPPEPESETEPEELPDAESYAESERAPVWTADAEHSEDDDHETPAAPAPRRMSFTYTSETT